MGESVQEMVIERLRAATDIAAGPDVRAAHLAAIEAAIALAPPPVAPGEAIAAPAKGSWLRARVVALTVAVSLGAPAAAAVAAQGAMPGAALYPLKLASERVVGFADDQVIARHRIDELDALVATGASIEELTKAVERATRAASAITLDRVLAVRLDALLDRVDRLRELQGGGPVAAVDLNRITVPAARVARERGASSDGGVEPAPPTPTGAGDTAPPVAVAPAPATRPASPPAQSREAGSPPATTAAEAPSASPQPAAGSQSPSPSPAASVPAVAPTLGDDEHERDRDDDATETSKPEPERLEREEREEPDSGELDSDDRSPDEDRAGRDSDDASDRESDD